MPLRLVDDTAYGAGWNGVAGLAPSQNAVYDAVEARAGLVTVADEGTDATSFPLFATQATGNLLSIKSNAGLTFNASTATLGATGLTVTNDATINGLTVGRGGGSVIGNSAFGKLALANNLVGPSNSAVGDTALYNTTSGGNTGVGAAALWSNTTGARQTGLGANAGRYIADGSTANAVSEYSTYLGADTKALADGGTNETVIGYNAVGLGSNSSVIGNSSSTVFRAWGTPTFGPANSLTLSFTNTATRTKTLQDTTSTLAEYGNNLGVFAASTSAAIGVGSIELGHATDTTIARVSAGVISIEGSNILTAATGQPLDATLTALAGLTIAADSLTIGTAADTFSQTTFAANTFPARASTGNLVAKTITDFGLSLVDDVDASAARTTLSLNNVTNNAQTQSAIVPNTAPAAGQILAGNAGGTAYAPVTLSGSGATASLSSAGVLTLSGIANASLANSTITIAGTAVALGGSTSSLPSPGAIGGTTPSTIAATSLACPTFTSAAAMTFTPTAGNNFNVACSGAGDFAVNTNQLCVDTSAAFVGIGTTSPSASLNVRAALRDTVHLHDTTAIAANNGAGLYLGGYYTGTTATTWAAVLSGKDNATDGNYAGYLSLYTRANGVGHAEVMRLTSAGNVGIGTTSPSALCHTAASTTARASICMAHGSAPTSPVDGDMWTTSSGLFVRINGVTKTVTLT